MAYTGLIKFTNHAATTLASDLTAAATSLSVASGDGALFPSLSGSQYFYATIEDATDATEFEVVKVTVRSTDTFTVTRAQDGTAAQAWAASDKVQLRLPSIAIEDLETQLSGYADTVSAATVSDTVYGAGWNGVTTIAPSKNAVYDKIETLVAGSVSDTAYGVGWDGETAVAPSKNAVYDKIETVITNAAALVSDTAYAGSWNAVTTIAPSKNAVYDKIETLVSDDAYAVGWNGDTDTAPSKNAVYDKVETLVSDDAYGAGWNGDVDTAPSKNAVYDKIEAIVVSGVVSDTAYGGSWDAVTTIAPSKNAVYDKIQAMASARGHHVDAYGASTAALPADNKTAIDLAIAAAIAGTDGSNTVIFGPGTYSTNAIVIPMTTTTAKGINIVGSGSKGAQATVISIAAAATGFHFSSDAATDDSTTYGSFTLRDISFTGGAISIQIGTAAKAYHPRSKFILDNVFCELYTSNGIKIFNALEGQMQNVVVRGVEGHTANDSALYIAADTAGLTCGDVSFYNCEFSGYDGGAVVADYAMYVTTGAVASTVAGLKFTDTHFYHGGTAAAYFAGSAGMIKDVSFLGCQFDYSGATTTTNVGIWLDNTDAATEEDVTMWKDFRIVGNYFQTYGKALYIQPGTAALHNVIAKQIVFTNNFIGNADVYGVSIQSAEDVVISNNVFRHCGNSGSASYLVYMSGWNRSFVISGNTHTANRSGTAGSQVPQNSNITSLVYLSSSSDHFTVSGNVGQIRDSATNAINLAVDMNTANGSVYGNIAYTSGLTGTTAYNFFDGTIQTLGTIYAGAFSGPGSAITALNASNISSGTMAVSYLGTGGTYPANSGASITNVDAITLLGNTWASPEAIGATTPAAGTFTTLKNSTALATTPVLFGTTTTPSEGVSAVFAMAAGSGLALAWNKSGGTGETDFINYGGGGNGGYRFYNFNNPGSDWTDTSPTLLFAIDYQGSIATADPGGGSGNWFLGTYAASVPTATGYVEIKVGSTRYKLLAATF